MQEGERERENVYVKQWIEPHIYTVLYCTELADNEEREKERASD